MNEREPYEPGPADVARVQKDGATWTLVLTKDLRHAPEKVWRALTAPEHLREWAPFDAAADLGHTGTVDVTLERLLAGTPIPRVAGPAAFQFAGWQRLNAAYAQQFGAET